jgi:hypothetical protein
MENLIQKSPFEFLSDRRFDMITRYLFFLSLKNEINQEYFEDLYRHTIFLQNKGREGAGFGHNKNLVYAVKYTVDDFVKEAKNLFLNMTEHGFDINHPVPFNNNGILNGCHRVACAITLNTKIWAQEYDNTIATKAYDSKWLNENFLPNQIDIIKTTYFVLKNVSTCVKLV